MTSRNGDSTISPADAIVMSNARLSSHEDRDRSKRRTPSSVSPLTSSTSMLAPTTSRMRGIRLTRTSIPFASRTKSIVICGSASLGSMITR